MRSAKVWNLQWWQRLTVSSEGARTLAQEWSPQRRKTDKAIRCPYCVEDQGFKTMLRHCSGDWFACSLCGHLALPSDPFFQCTCAKCLALKAVRGNLNPKSSVKGAN